jgi:hypothetical protein
MGSEAEVADPRPEGMLVVGGGGRKEKVVERRNIWLQEQPVSW